MNKSEYENLLKKNNLAQGDLTDIEFDRVIQIKKIEHLNSIKKTLLFFVILTIVIIFFMVVFQFDSRMI